MQFINFNGELLKNDSLILSAQTRLRFGDGFFETMRVFKKKIAFQEEHEKRIEHSLKLLELELANFNLNNEVAKTLKSNKIENARVRIQFFRCSAGRYLPINNKCSFIVETENEQEFKYEIQPLKTIGISTRYFKSSHFLGNIKSSSSLLNVMAALEAQQNNWSEAILLNENQMVCEAISSNIFLVHENTIITPSLSTGCVNGVMRKVVIHLLQQQNYVVEERCFSKEMLMTSKEIFLTNASKGVQQVLQIEDKMLQSNLIASKLVNLLNEALQN